MSDIGSQEKTAFAAPGRAAASPGAPGRRQLIQALVLGGFAGAVWFGAVRPMEDKLAAKQAELTSQSGSLATFESGLAKEEPLERAIEDLASRARRVNAWTAGSGDPTRLYEAFRTIASKCSVRIERVEPSATRSPRGAGPSKGDPGAELLGYSIEVTGTYQSVACFMDAVEQELGASKIASFHMSPCSATTSGVTNVPSDPLITAILETSHLKLTIPAVDGAPPKAAPLAQGAGS